MNRYFFFLALFLAFAPLPAVHALVEETENVEEPDAYDTETPALEETKKAPAKEKSSENAGEKATEEPKESKPGENLSGGYTAVILEGLNKVTGHSSRIEALMGSTVRFGTLEIIARSCWQSAPEDQPENAALLEIYEIKQGEPPDRIFLGWMYSSSPGLSSLEHPFYDITVIRCAKTGSGK